MEFSVVVPTLNGRRQLVGCLDALRERLPTAETIVVNGPSTDGTSGMLHERPDVDVLVEIADRNINVARNAGLDAATGDLIARIDADTRVPPDWARTIVEFFTADVRGDWAALSTLKENPAWRASYVSTPVRDLPAIAG